MPLTALEQSPNVDGKAQMTKFLPKQGWYSLLILALYAPVLISVGSRDVAGLWPGLSFVYFVSALQVLFAALSWLLARMAFAPTESAETESQR